MAQVITVAHSASALAYDACLNFLRREGVVAQVRRGSNTSSGFSTLDQSLEELVEFVDSLDWSALSIGQILLLSRLLLGRDHVPN